MQAKHAGLTSFRWPVVLIDQKFFLQLLYVTHQSFLSANEPMLHRLVSHCYNSSLTFSVMLSRWKWAYLELQKVKMSEALKSKKRRALFLYKFSQTRDNLNSYTRLSYTILQSWITRHLSYLWFCPSFGFSSVVVELVVMALFSWSTPVLFYWCPSLKFNTINIKLCGTFVRGRQSASTSLYSITE